MSVYKRNGTWYVSVSVEGRRVRASAGPGASKSQARQLEAQIRQDLIDGKKPGNHTLEEALTRWWETEGQHMKGKSIRAQVRSLLPYTIDRPLREAPAAAQDAWRDWAAEGFAPSTIHKRLSVLKRICNLAFRAWGWLEQPVAEKIGMPTVHNQRHIYLTAEEVERIAGACPFPDVADAIRLAAWTGLRKAELLRLLCGELPVRQNCIILDEKTKTGRPRVVPVAPPILSIIERLPLPMNRHRLYEGWDVARQVCGFKAVRWHDLRHTYASWLVQSGAPMKAVQELLGHADLHTTQRYAHLAPHHLEDAVLKMAATMNAPNLTPIRREKLS